MTREEVIKQEPCEDIISRQAYIERYRKWGYSEYGRKVDNETLAIRVAMSLPPVTPQPKTGHWISHREHCENLGVMPSGLGVYEWCSNCDCGIDVREWHRNHYNYCPNCGAKMNEPQESEEG